MIKAFDGVLEHSTDADGAEVTVTDIPTIHRHFIAAYTDRQPEDVTADEIGNFQQFWDSTPQALADVLAAGLNITGYNAPADETQSVFRRAVDQMVKHWMLTDKIPYLHYFSADLKAAYKKYDADGQKLVKDVLATSDHVFTRRYIQAAILPNMEQGFLSCMDTTTTRLLKLAFNIFSKEPPEATGTFWIFCTLFSMADDNRRTAMANAIGSTVDNIELFLANPKHAIPERITIEEKQAQEEPATKPDAEQAMAAAVHPCQAIQRGTRAKLDVSTIRKLAQYNSIPKYELSMDISVFHLLGQPVDMYLTDETGYRDFQLHFNNGWTRTRLFPFLLEAEDVTVAMAWEMLRVAGAQMITPLDLWHKIVYGVTDQDSKNSENEKRMLRELRQDLGLEQKTAKDKRKSIGILFDIVERVERLMHLEITYRTYKTKKTPQPRKTTDMTSEYVNTYIPYTGRSKEQGNKNIIVWEVAERNQNVTYDNFTPFPYRRAAEEGRLVRLDAASIDCRNLGVSGTLHIAAIRDAEARKTINAQSHGGNLEIKGIDKIYEYGRLDANDRQKQKDLATTPKELRAIKDRQRKRKDADALTFKRIAEGFVRTGLLQNLQIMPNGNVTAQTAISWEMDTKKRRARKTTSPKAAKNTTADASPDGEKKDEKAQSAEK